MKKIILLTMLFLFNACAFGGGTIGTGITGYGDIANRQAPTTYKLSAVISDSKGKPVSGVKVNVSGSIMNAQAISSAVGRFSVPVQSRSGESLKFIFTNGAVQSACESIISPAGEEEVSLNFKILESGKVRCP